ncbi:MAG: helix-turn-helix transcriptional regulator [Prevotella sp.]|nr:helix-turn-helix transcriptional regulator [Prevotella sp.]
MALDLQQTLAAVARLSDGRCTYPFSCCRIDKESQCDNMVTRHTLAYVMSGDMTVIQPNGKTIHLKKGVTAFLRRNHRVSKEKRPSATGEPFVGLFLQLDTELLKRVKKEQNMVMPQNPNQKITRENVFALPEHPFLDNVFQSLVAYYATDINPSKELIESKLREAVYVLLQLRPELTPVLFDFVPQWKVDVEDFMEENFRSDLTVEQFAHYTGRSLTSFKHDFDEVFHLTPQRWLTRRRLAEAKAMMEVSGKGASDVYLSVGFKNLSHFSTAFKKEYGFPPSQLVAG